MNKYSDPCNVLYHICHKCGLRGYIFPDQLLEKENVYPREMYWAKCCNGRARGEKKAEIKGFIDKDRACRLQKIRRRGTTINQSDAIANF